MIYRDVTTNIMEKQMGKKMENEMKTGGYRGVYRVKFFRAFRM